MSPGSGGTTIQQQAQQPGIPQSGETIGSQQGILQSIRAGDIFRSGSIDPRQQLQTMDADRQRLTEQLAAAQQRYAENLSAIGSNPAARGNVDNLFMQIQGIREQVDNLDASKKLLEEQAGVAQQGADVTKQFLGKLQSGLETGDFVDPAERAAMVTAASQLSQDVATTRGLNRTDVPVMQAIAPSLASMWLQQQNANKAFYTGAQQFQQGLGLQQNQTQMQASNPGLGLASVFSGVRGSNITGKDMNTAGLANYLGAGGSALQGAGTAAMAAKAVFCWIAEALYGQHAPETHLIRAWLTNEYRKTGLGRLVLMLYAAWGQTIAKGVRRSAVLRALFLPLFDRALVKAKAHYGC